MIAILAAFADSVKPGARIGVIGEVGGRVVGGVAFSAVDTPGLQSYRAVGLAEKGNWFAMYTTTHGDSGRLHAPQKEKR